MKRIRPYRKGFGRYLRLISNGKKITIGPTVGNRTLHSLAESGMPLEGVCDCANLGAESDNCPTQETEVGIYQIVRRGRLKRVLGFFSTNFHDLALTQDQLITFLYENWSWVSINRLTTCFVMKRGQDLFFVKVFRIVNNPAETDVNFKDYWHSTRVYPLSVLEEHPLRYIIRMRSTLVIPKQRKR